MSGASRAVILVQICINLLFVISDAAKVINSHRLPRDFPVCYRNDPEINKCLLEATETVRPYIAKGVPEMKMPQFEPFEIPKIVLEQGTRSLNFKAELTNVIAHGLSKYKFSRFDFDVPNLQFFCDAHIPGLFLEGDYTVTGRVLIAPIEGKGKFTATIDTCDVKVYQKVKENFVDGEKYLGIVLTNSSIDVSGPKAHLDGLFNGNEALNDATNKAINDNVDELFTELKPAVEHTLTRIMEDLLLRAISTNVPYDYLYPIKK